MEIEVAPEIISGPFRCIRAAAPRQLWCVSMEVSLQPFTPPAELMEGHKQSSQSNQLGWGFRTLLFKSPTAAWAQGPLQLTQAFSHLISHQPPSMETAQHFRTPFFSCLSDPRREKMESVPLQLWPTVSHSSSYDHSKRSNNSINNLLTVISNLLLSSPEACSLLLSVFHIL